MLSRRIKNNKNRKTRKKGGTNGWNDITLKNDPSKLPILYVLISGEGYAEDKTPPSLPQIKAKVSSKLKQILDALVISEKINLDAPGNVYGDDDGGGDTDTPQTEWRNRKDQPLNPHYQFVNILFFHVSKENRIKYLFLYFLKKTFLDDINIIRLIELAMKFISESTQVVDLNVLLNKLLIYYNETHENEYLIHPFLLVYAFLFNCKIKIDYQNGTLKVAIFDEPIIIYEYVTNVVNPPIIQTPLTFELDKQFDETEPFSPNFLKPLPVVPLNKQPVLRIGYTVYKLRVGFTDGGEYKLESYKETEDFRDIQTLASLHNCDAADFQLVLKYMIIYKGYLENNLNKQVYVDQFHITNMSNDDLFSKIYEMMTRFAHMNIFIEINCRKSYTPAYITLAEARDVVKKMYTSIIDEIRNVVKSVYLSLDEEGIAIIVNYIVEDKYIFSVIIGNKDIAINNITQYLTFIREKGITIANLTTNILRVLIWVIDLEVEWSKPVMEFIITKYQNYTKLNQREINSLIAHEEVPKGEILDKYQNYLECYAILNVREEQVERGKYIIHSDDTLLKADANYSDYKDLILIKPNGELRNVLRQGENITITYDKSLTNKFVELLQCSRADEEGIRGILSRPLFGKAKPKKSKPKNQGSSSANENGWNNEESKGESEEESEEEEKKEEVVKTLVASSSTARAATPAPAAVATSSSSTASSAKQLQAAVQTIKIPVIRITYTPIPLERTNIDSTDIICCAFLGHPHILYIREVYKGCAGSLLQNINLRDFLSDQMDKSFFLKILPLEGTSIYEKLINLLSGESKILLVDVINIKQENELTDIIKQRIHDANLKDYTILSLIAGYTKRDDNDTSYFAFLRTGSGNITPCHDDTGNMTLSFDIFSKKIRRQVTLEEIDSEIDHRGNFNNSQVVTLTFVMMHKKAVECVQSYLDNSGRGGNDVDCLKILKDIDVNIDKVVALNKQQVVPRFSQEEETILADIANTTNK